MSSPNRLVENFGEHVSHLIGASDLGSICVPALLMLIKIDTLSCSFKAQQLARDGRLSSSDHDYGPHSSELDQAELADESRNLASSYLMRAGRHCDSSRSAWVLAAGCSPGAALRRRADLLSTQSRAHTHTKRAAIARTQSSRERRRMH